MEIRRLASSNATLEKAVKSQSELIETIQKKLCALESTLQNQGNLTSDDRREFHSVQLRTSSDQMKRTVSEELD